MLNKIQSAKNKKSEFENIKFIRKKTFLENFTIYVYIF